MDSIAMVFASAASMIYHSKKKVRKRDTCVGNPNLS